jgi:hypothetical protein
MSASDLVSDLDEFERRLASGSFLKGQAEDEFERIVRKYEDTRAGFTGDDAYEITKKCMRIAEQMLRYQGPNLGGGKTRRSRRRRSSTRRNRKY